MSEKLKLKRSRKSRLRIPDWRWRLLILVAMYGFILLPALVTIPLNILISGLIPLTIAIIIPFGMGYILELTRRVSNIFTGCLVFVAVSVFALTAGFYLFLSYVVWLATSSSGLPSLNVFTTMGILLLPMPIAIHIGIAGERLAIRNYPPRSEPRIKRKRKPKHHDGKRLSDEYDAVDDNSLDLVEESESNEEQQKFDSLES